jgi:hypothetical protein
VKGLDLAGDIAHALPVKLAGPIDDHICRAALVAVQWPGLGMISNRVLVSIHRQQWIVWKLRKS